LIEITGTRITRIQGEMAGIRSEAALQRSLENACLVAKVCEDFRGQDVQVLDLTNVTSLFDFFVIATGNNRRQLRAMADSADDVMESRQSFRMGSEGDDGPWICHDYGDVVLHVFTPDGRALYDLENLWGDAIRVDWKPVAQKISGQNSTPQPEDSPPGQDEKNPTD
jgi:ribosome-associated protein